MAVWERSGPNSKSNSDRMFRGNPAILQLGVFTVINFCFSMGGRVGQMLSNPEKYLCQSAECLVGRKQSREMTMAPDIGFLIGCATFGGRRSSLRGLERFRQVGTGTRKHTMTAPWKFHANDRQAQRFQPDRAFEERRQAAGISRRQKLRVSATPGRIILEMEANASGRIIKRGKLKV